MLRDLPSHISPDILTTPWFSLHWYGLMYVVAYATVYFLAARRMIRERFAISNEQLIEALLWSIIGLAIGARLGYVFFYDFGYYVAHPLAVISPFDASGRLAGITGLSYHGGLIGAIVSLLLFCRFKRIRVWDLSDLLVPVIPLGYMFGRIGNFLNGELYGRPSSVPWAMIFPRDPLQVPRHPSQLYEAFLEGVVLFAVLWSVRKRIRGPKMLGVYLIGYALARFIVEFFREPDPQLGFVFGPLTMGQVLSTVMVIAGAVLIVISSKKKMESG